MLSDEIKALEQHCKAMETQLKEMRSTLDKAAKEWPDYQVRCGAVWYDRSKVPPKGFIWASNGVSVWLIQGDGEPIPDTATAVKFWTDAYIPAPPELIAVK